MVWRAIHTTAVTWLPSVSSREGGLMGTALGWLGVSLFLVDAGASGLSRACYPMNDGQEAADIEFVNVSAEALIGEVDEV